MPVNYNALNTQAPQQLGAMFDPAVQAEKQSRLSDLAMNRDAKRMQMEQMQQQMQAAPAQAQRSEQLFQQGQEDRNAKMQATQAQQKEKYGKKLDFSIANDLTSGLPIELVKQRAIKQARGFGFTDDEMSQGLEALTSIKDPKARIAHFRDSANEKFEKQSGASSTPYFTPLQTAQGVMSFNARTGQMEPISVDGRSVVGSTSDPRLQRELSGAKATGSTTGKETGTSIAKLEDIKSQMPQLEKLVKDLSVLGKKATYTQGGQFLNTARRQLGMDVGEGAIKRKEYISKVDNEVLPLLRQTFGAAFTVKEGESLRATLGDADASPEEKDAVLRSFIETKIEMIGSLERRTKQSESKPQAEEWSDL